MVAHTVQRVSYDDAQLIFNNLVRNKAEIIIQPQQSPGLNIYNFIIEYQINNNWGALTQYTTTGPNSFSKLFQSEIIFEFSS